MATPRTSVRLRPIIRLFVSSTFGDLKAERDALQRDVFPRLFGRTSIRLIVRVAVGDLRHQIRPSMAVHFNL